jgi:hypothetical protein
MLERMILVLAIVAGLNATAQAKCTCQCVNGAMQPLCTNPLEAKPLCPPTVCPLDVPIGSTFKVPSVPPFGATVCEQARVCNTSGDCRWKEVCR